MRVLFCLLMAMFLPAHLAAQAGPVPGTELVQPVFDKADLVCSCRVELVEIVTRDSTNTDGNPGKLVRATASILDVYKSVLQPSGPIVFEYPKDPMSENPGVKAGDVVLLFLGGLTSGVYELADPYIGLTTFSELSQVPGGLGLEKLQSALAASVRQGNRGDQISAMRLLEGFSRLDSSTLVAASALSSSADPEIAFTALAVLLKTRTPDSVAKFRRYVEAYKENQPPIGLVSAAGELSLVTDPEALADIERLSGSRFLSIQIAAMDAIRHIASAKSAPVLIRRLDDPNRTVRYSAMITLAEIFGERGGELTPDMELFDKKPQYYTNLWKEWWAKEGSKLYPSAEPPK
jgi:hypothetical protein